MEQNKNAGKNKIPQNKATLGKENLSKTNINFGNFKANFNTVSQTDYIPKTPAINNNRNDITNVNLRTHSYKLGDHNIDYLSDNKLRFTNPNVIKKIK